MRKTLWSMTVTFVVILTFGLVAFLAIPQPGQAPTLAPSVQSAPPYTFEAVRYEVSEPSYQWIDISASSDEQITPTDFEDNLGSAAIDIGFYFPFYDNIYRELRLSDNGYLYFGGDETLGSGTPQTIPSETDSLHNLIAPLGGDQFRTPDTTIYIARQDSPEQRTIFQVENSYWCCSLDATNSYQVILYPDGRILMQYQTVESIDPATAFLTIGIENADGSQGEGIYTGFLAGIDLSETARLFDPGESVLGQLLFLPSETSATASQTITLEADLLNLTGTESSFSLTPTLQVNGVDTPLDQGWAVDIVAAPSPLANATHGPLQLTLTLPDTVSAGDTATLTVTAASEAFASTAEVTFSVVVE